MSCSKMATNQLEEENQKLRDILYKGRFDSWVFESLYNGGKIEVCGLGGNCYNVGVNHKTTILDVKKNLRQQINIPNNVKFRLCFGGSRGSAILEDHRTLFHYRVPSGATIHMIMESTRETHKIMSQNAFADYKANYTEEKNYELLIQIYKKVINAKKTKNS